MHATRKKHGAEAPLREFLHRTPLERPFLVGYYGGGNFGDELLLETLLAQLHERGVKRVIVPYQRPRIYGQHHAFDGCELIDAGSPWSTIKGMLRSKEIIVGGGGLWSKEYSPRMTALGATLLMMRLLRKKIYIIGVGFYDSAQAHARFGAWIAAKASDRIIVRDEESLRNFSRYSKRVQIDKDIAYLNKERAHASSKGSSDGTPAQSPLGPLPERTLLIVYRRFAKSAQWQRKYDALVRETVKKNTHLPVKLLMFEADEMDPRGLRLLERLAQTHPRCDVVRFDYNPVALIEQLRRDHANCVLVAPQFHAKVVADITGTTFFPLAYDHKCLQLLQQLGVRDYHTMDDVRSGDIQAFITGATGGRP